MRLRASAAPTTQVKERVEATSTSSAMSDSDYVLSSLLRADSYFEGPSQLERYRGERWKEAKRNSKTDRVQGELKYMPEPEVKFDQVVRQAALKAGHSVQRFFSPTGAQCTQLQRTSQDGGRKKKDTRQDGGTDGIAWQ